MSSLRSVFPSSVTDGMMATLVGFGIFEVVDRGRQVGGGMFSVKLGPVVSGRRALVELEIAEHREPLILLFIEERKQVLEVLQCTRSDLLKEHAHALRPLPRPRVVSIRAYKMKVQDKFPRSRDYPEGTRMPATKPLVTRPLLLAIDEATDSVILAIGNLGDRIEYKPDAPPSYKPTWYEGLTVAAP